MDPDLHDRWLAEADGLVRGSPRRAGVARSTVLEALARDGQCLVTVNALLDTTRRRRPVSAATVYRVLDELVDAGLVHRHSGPDGVTRFEIVDHDHRHHHLFDEDTGAITAFADEGLERALTRVGDRLGYDLVGREITLRGSRRVIDLRRAQQPRTARRG